ncbi:MAG: GntR family transcriptional regulator [Rhodobacter sp.]|nr:GntR family transcriptional regulator [Rhodobacter sp.]
MTDQTTLDSAETSDKRVLVQLRRMIMDGALAPGDKISEVSVAKLFAVSRTPARLALRTLEVEGLIKKRDGRGFTIQEFDLGDVSKAYEVRGVLEGLAAATLARRGMPEDVAARLREAIDAMDRAMASDAPMAVRVSRYQDGNMAFHETIMRGCGNEFVGFAFDRMSTLPMIQLGTLVFNAEKPDEELMRLRFGNMQHRLILDAIDRRDPQRAEALMREHANQTLVYSTLFAGRD